ncbi:hypothetical protein LAZ67_20000331, partial [Cordylochernes scorpioides]
MSHPPNSVKQQHHRVDPDISHSLPTHHHNAAAAAKEEQRQRELEEARARAAQMEKTMRWWSDCTANWREKWSKVRTERNKAREEARILRNKLDTQSKELGTLRQEKQEAEEMLATLKRTSRENEEESALRLEETTTSHEPVSPQDNNAFRVEVSQVIQAANEDLEFLDKLLQKNTAPEDNHVLEDGPAAGQRMSLLQFRLEEAMKTIETERMEKQQLLKSLENLQLEAKSWQASAGETSSLSIAHLSCVQLEQLQAENAAEWARRERLETEKSSLERENKKMRSHISDLEERVERKAKQLSSAAASDLADFKSLHLELCDKNKELADLKHANGKLKKALQDKATELGHAARRAEQYEAEVKKLRARIEELKKEFAAAEDEVDNGNNALRKLQRTNEELQEQVDGLKVQVEHLER